mmetsp:Transcript_68401/g.164182  ORF Transcript_68401/g.164182 Transcript_68401/m.164182 type:complete len:367 (-) Transcript_68401:153-1253(-)
MAAADLVDASKLAEEREALKKYGVLLREGHLEGYKIRPDQAFEQKELKPWEMSTDVMADIPSLPRMYTLENWANPEVKFAVKSGIAYITLNRPEANNAMNGGINQGLQDAVYYLQEHTEIRIAVLQAEGKMFCAGGDPKGFQAAQAGAGVIQGEGEVAAGPPSGESIARAAESGSGNATSAQTFAKLLYQFATLPQYTIGCAQGSAMGGGVGLLCVCDTVMATQRSFFALSEVKLGVIPATISPYVIRKIGAANAKKVFCTGESIKPMKAAEYGLVQQLLPTKDEFPKAIQKIASQVQQCAPGAVARSKRLISMLMYQPVSESLMRFTAQEYAAVRKGAEADVAIAGLSAKKRPAWMETQLKVDGA